MGDILRLSRKWMIVSALALLALSWYELMTRLDMLRMAFKLVADIVIGEEIPLGRAAGYVWQNRKILETPLFLLLGMLFAVAALIVRTSRRGCMVLLPIGLVMTVWGTFSAMTVQGEMIRFIKLLPLLALSVLCGVNAVVQPAQCKRLRLRSLRIGQSAGYAPASVSAPPRVHRLKRGEMPPDYPYAKENAAAQPVPLPAVREGGVETDQRRFRYGIADHPKRDSRRRIS